MMERINANGVEIAYEISGSGPPIVLCHGGEADHQNFYNFTPILAQRFTVINYDQRDTGESRNGDDAYTVKDLGKDVGALIEGLGLGRAHVFGTSVGGIIAQEAALTCPDQVDHLILSVTWPGSEKHVSDEFYQFALSEKTPDQARAYRAMFFGTAFAEAHPDLVEEHMARVMTTRTPEGRVRRGTAVFTHNVSDRLPSVRSPTLVLMGGDDRIILPSNPRKLAELIPGAKLSILEGVGHATTLEAPELVAQEVMRFVGLD